MAMIQKINLFYQEPDPDRWLPLDRYPRRVIRRLVRGRQRPGSIMMIALSLMKGLEQLGVPYRFNDHRYIRKHPEEVACIIGKPHLLDEYQWENPILFGAGIFSHPVAYPDLLRKHPNIRKILVPGPWVRDMFTPYYGEEKVAAWPAGIDTDRWRPSGRTKDTDLLIYSKFLWDKKENVDKLLEPILAAVKEKKLTYHLITYGTYTHEQLAEALARCKAGVFLCEHESQGLAYQQMLASGVPLLAWDRESFWIDPSFYPHKVLFEPASSVPYWDERCGMKFKDLNEFRHKLPAFIQKVNDGEYEPRALILEELTLKRSAEMYLSILSSIQ